MHVMLDLETWGTAPGSALRSIGAVAFQLNERETRNTFYRNIDKDSCLAVGLTIDPDTVAWWDRQSKEAVAALDIDPGHLNEVVYDFHQWFCAIGGHIVWSHGANFDEPLWGAVCRAVSRPAPWKFWDVRCTRTLYAIKGFDPRSIPRKGVHHNALDDAIHQARCVQEALKAGE